MDGGTDLGGSRQFTQVIEVHGCDGGDIGSARRILGGVM